MPVINKTRITPQSFLPRQDLNQQKDRTTLSFRSPSNTKIDARDRSASGKDFTDKTSTERFEYQANENQTRSSRPRFHARLVASRHFALCRRLRFFSD